MATTEPTINDALAGVLDKAHLAAAVDVFDEFCHRELLTADAIDVDAVRKELDEAFLERVLEFPKKFFVTDGPLDLIRKKLAQEPSLTGRKKGQPKPKKKPPVTKKPEKVKEPVKTPSPKGKKKPEVPSASILKLF
jgi:hypothetical protein